MKQSKKTDEKWADILRNAARASGETQYRLAKQARLGETQLARFMAGAGLYLDSAERLGRVLGVELRAK
jgi:ribosome-binding protein aMBF1 (putative translation factor)